MSSAASERALGGTVGDALADLGPLDDNGEACGDEVTDGTSREELEERDMGIQSSKANLI